MTFLKNHSDPVDLMQARVLISNDDGISAPGLKSLEKLLRPLVKQLYVVAPELEQSATSHALSLRSPLRIKKVSETRYSVNGTPTDAVLLGITELLKNCRPDLLLSGINRGGNLGQDITYSGTVGAAIEGTLLGVPSVALSQIYTDNQPVRWSTAETWAPKILKKILSIDWPKHVLMNINFPDVTATKVTGIKICRQGHRNFGHVLQRGIDPRNEEYFWIGAQREYESSRKGSDLEATSHGAVSITPLSVDMTDTPTLKAVKKIFND